MVPRSHTNTNMKTQTLPRNHSSGHQPVLASPQMEIGHGARQPPRNRVTHIAETVNMLMYSARKNIANFSEEYSVWKPPTSSDSASGRSKGARLVSPTIEIMKITKLGKSRIAYQPGMLSSKPPSRIGGFSPCDITISLVDIEPDSMNTATMDRP